MFGNAGFGGFTNTNSDDFKDSVWGHAVATEVRRHRLGHLLIIGRF